MGKLETLKNAELFRADYWRWRTTPKHLDGIKPNPADYRLDPERDAWVIAQMIRSVEWELDQNNLRA